MWEIKLAQYHAPSKSLNYNLYIVILTLEPQLSIIKITNQFYAMYLEDTGN